MMHFPTTEEQAHVVVAGWEALCRYNNHRLRSTRKYLQSLKSRGGASGLGDIRGANQESVMRAEDLAASELGLYKARHWERQCATFGSRERSS